MREEERELWARFARSVKPLVRSDVPKVPPKETAHAPQKEAIRRNAGYPAEPVVRIRQKPDGGDTPRTPIRPLSPGAMTFLTVGELAVATHLRNRAIKRKNCSTSADAVHIGKPQPGLDTGSWKRLTRGQTQVERRLDLHGMTAQAAFLRLREFLVTAHREDVRCVEIVTGLGSGAEGGILRRELPFWLGRDDLRRLVLAVTHAHDANHGAVRVLLRRRSGVRR
ncbi:DNA mismatch repair protein [Acetobacter oeni]|nr:DNA mismatch repair protein [Acetobacter oeni]